MVQLDPRVEHGDGDRRGLHLPFYLARGAGLGFEDACLEGTSILSGKPVELMIDR